MINILIPLAGKSLFFDNNEFIYPKPLIEIHGKPMIQWVYENYLELQEECRFIFAVNKTDCDKYHLDYVLRLVTAESCHIVKLEGETQGALCSCLMTIDYIDNEDNLIIVNGDQIICTDISQVLLTFKNKDYDAGTICFDSVHPRWSYVRLDENNLIVETAEKRPISRNAIAGFYFFKMGKNFVQAAMRSVKKDSNVDGKYFISSSINELVLDQKKMGIFRIKPESYLSFYSPQKIKQHEKDLIFYHKSREECYAACTIK